MDFDGVDFDGVFGLGEEGRLEFSACECVEGCA